jgi:hypothetical protein
MRKYLAATVLGAMLIAGQAAASDSGLVSLGDRLGSPSATSDDMQGMNGGALWFTLAALLITGLVSWAALDTSSNNPASP